MVDVEVVAEAVGVVGVAEVVAAASAPTERSFLANRLSILLQESPRPCSLVCLGQP